jgi:hypothetical protein
MPGFASLLSPTNPCPCNWVSEITGLLVLTAEWNRLLNGRLVHSVISEEQTELVDLAIENQRQIKQLLLLWEAETTNFILDLDDQNEE